MSQHCLIFPFLSPLSLSFSSRFVVSCVCTYVLYVHTFGISLYTALARLFRLMLMNIWKDGRYDGGEYPDRLKQKITTCKLSKLNELSGRVKFQISRSQARSAQPDVHSLHAGSLRHIGVGSVRSTTGTHLQGESTGIDGVSSCARLAPKPAERCSNIQDQVNKYVLLCNMTRYVN